MSARGQLARYEAVLNSVQPLPARSTAARARRFTLDPWLIPAALLGLIPLLSLLRPGIANTSDGMVHILRTVQVVELMNAGVLYPQWAPDFYFGYGYPFFLFYAPGAHMVAALFALLGLGASGGLLAVQVLSVILYGVGGYLAARALFEGLARPRVVSAAALGAAALWVYAPLRLRELFLQGNLSQLFALSLIPLALWALVRTARRGSWRWAALSALILAALLYAHHPTAFLAYPVLLVAGFAVALFDGERSGLVRFAPLLTAFALALALGAPFWLPWLLESGYGSLGRMESGMFNAALNLVPAGQLFSPGLIPDASSINPPRPHTLGLLQAGLAGLGTVTAVVLFVRAPSRIVRGRLAVLLTLAGLLVVSLALMLPLAAPAWTTLPIAKFIAFPWRLLGPAGLLAAIVGAVPLLLLTDGRSSIAGVAVLIALALLSVAPYLFPSPGLWRPEPPGGVGLADIGRHEVQNGWRGTTSANEYLPRWVEDADPPLSMLSAYEAGETPPRLDVALLPAGSRAEEISAGPLEDVYRLALPEPATVTLSRFYYPGWQAWIDGNPASIRPGSPFGLIELDIPAGEHELRVGWRSTPPRTAGWVLFGVGLLVTAWLLLRRERRGTSEIAATDPEPAGGTGYGWLWAVGVIVVLTGLKAGWVEPRTQWFRRQSPVDAPATMTHPLHVRFANGVELLGYDLPREEVGQGDELAVRLYWRTHEPLDTNLMSYLHLDAPVTQETWVNVTKEHAGDMPAKGWPVGFYVVDDFRLRVPADTQPVRANLNVGLLEESGRRVLLANGGESVALGSVAVRGSRRPYERGEATELGYRLGDSITLAAYDADVIPADPGSGSERPAVRLTLYWRTAQPLAVDYTVFAHLMSAGGKREQGDGPACGGACPTTAWTPGGMIVDTRMIPLPPGVAMDAVDVLVGLYDPQSGQRLPATDRQGARLPDDAIRLEVTRPAAVTAAPTP